MFFLGVWRSAGIPADAFKSPHISWTNRANRGEIHLAKYVSDLYVNPGASFVIETKLSDMINELVGIPTCSDNASINSLVLSIIITQLLIQFIEVAPASLRNCPF